MGLTHRKNIIVIGAGASKEFGLPTGKELTEELSAITNIRPERTGASYKLIQTLELKERNESGTSDINHLLDACRRISDSMPLAPSIDNFLDTHQGNADIVFIGKLAITHAIQRAERDSILYTDDRVKKINFNLIENTWISKLFKILVAQRSYDSFLEALSNITFVSFNYDRCIQKFFYTATQQYFDPKPADLSRLLECLDIKNPYGNIGTINFEVGAKNTAEYGNVVYGADLLNAAKGIKTFTEQADDNHVSQIRGAFREAEIVIFLGFGFLPLNMNLLFGGEKFEAERVAATAKGLSKVSIHKLRSELLLAFPQIDRDVTNLLIGDITCSELFHEYERYIIA